MSAVPGSMSKTGEAGASSWGPQDENMGLARKFLIVFISYCSSAKYEAVPVEIICIPYCLSLPGGVETLYSRFMRI